MLTQTQTDTLSYMLQNSFRMGNCIVCEFKGKMVIAHDPAELHYILNLLVKEE